MRMINQSSIRSAVVLGAGIIGLTTALTLQSHGYAVRIIADKTPMDTTSAISAALWFPYRAEPLSSVMRWSTMAYNVFLRQQYEYPDCGIMTTRFIEVFSDEPEHLWWRNLVPNVERVSKQEMISDFPQFTAGFATNVPVIQMHLYLPFLWALFEKQGGTFTQETITDIATLCANTPSNIMLINCTGLGAKHLLDDKLMYALRGDVIVVENHGLRRSVIHEYSSTNPRYTIAREHDVVIGGTAFQYDDCICKEDIAHLTMPLQQHYEKVLQTSAALEPSLTNAPILAYKVGLRPGRTMVRLEKEFLYGRAVVHNYGHGGSGVTLSWGCARDAVTLLDA
jgi:D-amino-acid oxidase